MQTFWQTTEDGLVFAAKLLQLELTPERSQLMQAYRRLKSLARRPRIRRLWRASRSDSVHRPSADGRVFQKRTPEVAKADTRSM